MDNFETFNSFIVTQSCIKEVTTWQIYEIKNIVNTPPTEESIFHDMKGK